MEKYVLDTNLFFNMEPGLGLGKKTEEVIKAATLGIKKLKSDKKAEFFMPPKVVDELLSFFEDKNQPFLKEFLAQISVKSPDITSVQFPAAIFYQIVDDVRGRSYRGLTIAEEELQKAVSKLQGPAPVDKKDSQIAIGQFIKSLRDRYRQATRVGFLDSVADLDLIVLAKEIEGYLVSTDEGVIRWGRQFGVKEMEATLLGKKLSE